MNTVKVKTIKCLSIEDAQGNLAIRRAVVGDKVQMTLNRGIIAEGTIKTLTDKYVTLQNTHPYTKDVYTLHIEVKDIQFYTFLN